MAAEFLSTRVEVSEGEGGAQRLRFSFGDQHSVLQRHADSGEIASLQIGDDLFQDNDTENSNWAFYCGYLIAGGNSTGSHFYSAEYLSQRDPEQVPATARLFVLASLIQALRHESFADGVKTNAIRSLTVLGNLWPEYRSLVAGTVRAFADSATPADEALAHAVSAAIATLADPDNSDDSILERLLQAQQQFNDADPGVLEYWSRFQDLALVDRLLRALPDAVTSGNVSALRVIRPSLPEAHQQRVDEALFECLNDTGSAAVFADTGQQLLQTLPGRHLRVFEICQQRLTGMHASDPLTTEAARLLSHLNRNMETPSRARLFGGGSAIADVLQSLQHLAGSDDTRLDVSTACAATVNLVAIARGGESGRTLLGLQSQASRGALDGPLRFYGEGHRFMTALRALEDFPLCHVSVSLAFQMVESALDLLRDAEPAFACAAIRFLAMQHRHHVPVINVDVEGAVRVPDLELKKRSLDAIESLEGEIEPDLRTVLLSGESGPTRMSSKLPLQKKQQDAWQRYDAMESAIIEHCASADAAVAACAMQCAMEVRTGAWDRMGALQSGLMLSLEQGQDDMPPASADRLTTLLLRQWNPLPDKSAEILTHLRDEMLKRWQDSGGWRMLQTVAEFSAAVSGEIGQNLPPDASVHCLQSLVLVAMAPDVPLSLSLSCAWAIIDAPVWSSTELVRGEAARVLVRLLSRQDLAERMMARMEQDQRKKLCDVLAGAIADVDNMGDVWRNAVTALAHVTGLHALPVSRYGMILNALDQVLANQDEEELSTRVIDLLRTLATTDAVPARQRDLAARRLVDAATLSTGAERRAALVALDGVPLTPALRQRLTDELPMLRASEDGKSLRGVIDIALASNGYSVRRERSRAFLRQSANMVIGGLVGFAISSHQEILLWISSMASALAG